MQIGIIYIGEDKNLLEYARIFMKNLNERQYNATLINTNMDTTIISNFLYLIFFIETDHMFSKVYLTKLEKFFKNAGIVRAKFASAFVNKGFSTDKKMLKYMKRIEKEGIILHDTGILFGNDQAENAVKNLEPIK
jgi:hypothetical protein